MNMTTTPKISVVIPVYNNISMFLDNLKLNLQFFKNSEVVIVDDASEKSVQDAISNDSKLKTIRNIRVITNSTNLGYYQR